MCRAATSGSSGGGRSRSNLQPLGIQGLQLLCKAVDIYMQK